MSAGGSINSVHTDYLGTPRVITNGMSVVWKWDATDPFGSNAPSIAQVVYNPRFAGQYYDSETGLHYNHYRSYDPQMGRYMQPDPLGLAAGKNPFNYVNQNPLNATDRDGLLDESKIERTGFSFSINLAFGLAPFLKRPFNSLFGLVIFYEELEVPTDYDKNIKIKFGRYIGEGYLQLIPLLLWNNPNPEHHDFRRDCHGITFGSGAMWWMDNDQVDNLLIGDRYQKINKEAVRPGDVAIYREKGQVVHSVTVHSVKNGILVIGKGGNFPESEINILDSLDRVKTQGGMAPAPLNIGGSPLDN